MRARFLECERMREAVSAQLDGELSELEAIRLRTHLDGCDSCREFEAAAAAAVVMVAAGGVFASLHGGAAIRGAEASDAAYNNRADMQQLARQQQQRNFQQLLVRRAQYEANQIVRRPGLQNPSP
jgi:anti-sigma factor RsiW